MQEKKIFTLKSDTQRAECSKYLLTIRPDEKKPYKVVITPGSEDRTSKQRRLQFLWYRERAQQNGNGAKYEEQYCKLTFGVPIARCDSTEFNEFYDLALNHLTYEQQLDAMAFVPVTRWFKVKQNAEYLTDIENDAGEHGWHLTHPDDLYWDALMRASR